MRRNCGCLPSGIGTGTSNVLIFNVFCVVYYMGMFVNVCCFSVMF